MVDFDLRQLSAPLEELRPEVEAAYKRLDDKWDAVANALRKLPIPCDIGYTFSESLYGPPDSLTLEWRKWKGKKRICIVSYVFENTPEGPEETETVTPYDEWGGEQRVEMLQHVPNLFKSAIKQTNAFIAETKEEEEEA